MNLTRRSFIGMLAFLPFAAKAAVESCEKDSCLTIESLNGFKFVETNKLAEGSTLTRAVIRPLTPEDICELGYAETIIYPASWHRKRITRYSSSAYDKALEELFGRMTRAQKETWFKPFCR